LKFEYGYILKTLHLSIIIGVIIVAVSGVLFVLITRLDYEISFNIIQVNGTVKTNSTTMPRFVLFSTSVGTKSVNVESGSYSTTLSNNLSYHVTIIYDYKVPPPPSKYTGNTVSSRSAEGQCDAGMFDLHVLANQTEYNVSCPKM